jgi:hypothetical protein
MKCVFLSALPVLIVPPGAFFFLLVCVQLSLKVGEWTTEDKHGNVEKIP